MKLIHLSQGQFTVVDDRDFSLVNQFQWYTRKRSDGKGFYVVFMGTKPDGKPGQIFMHNLIMKPEPGFRIDHRDGNGLNNTRLNLREATQQQNCFNRIKHKALSSSFKGVSFDTKSGKWRTRITYNGKTISLGHYQSEEKASRVYRAAASIHFGSFAK